MSARCPLLCLSGVFLLMASCAPADEPPAARPEAAGETIATDAASSDDPLSGTWSGTWGPSATDRNDVTLELVWDGSELRGTVNPGPNAIVLDSASFDPPTGAVAMSASATNFRGEEVHYQIDGHVEDGSMSGTWVHEGAEGDFTITME